MKKKNTKADYQNAIERAISKLDGMIFDQEATLKESREMLNLVNKSLLKKLEIYLKLQIIFLKRVLMDSNNKMKLAIFNMEHLTENVVKTINNKKILELRRNLGKNDLYSED